jgi:hypothetical protein
MSYNDIPFVQLGGGLKRWRIAKVVNGRYYNSVPTADSHVYIPSTDSQALSQRPGIFEQILGAPDPAQLTLEIVAMIEEQRENLRQSPASCMSRERREDYFQTLYTHLQDNYGTPPLIVDSQYRSFEDYVFAELRYDTSKTCCWNSSTHEMYMAIVSYAESKAYDPATGECSPPPIFMATGNGGYDEFEAHAEILGIPWVPWSADEYCPQAATTLDEPAEAAWAPFCMIISDLLDVPAGTSNYTDH